MLVNDHSLLFVFEQLPLASLVGVRPVCAQWCRLADALLARTLRAVAAADVVLYDDDVAADGLGALPPDLPPVPPCCADPQCEKRRQVCFLRSSFARAHRIRCACECEIKFREGRCLVQTKLRQTHTG